MPTDLTTIGFYSLRARSKLVVASDLDNMPLGYCVETEG